MKQLLSLLLCFVFLNAQTFAKHELPGGGLRSITGTYGGVMLPTSTTLYGVSAPASNSIGLFSFVVPQAGFGNGSTLMFANGAIYTGSITAIGDPSTLKITAIIDANYDYAISMVDTSGTSGASVIVQELTATANGTMKLTVENSVGFLNFPSLEGTATIEVSQTIDTTTYTPIISEKTEYSVTGIQQSTSTLPLVSAAVTTATP